MKVLFEAEKWARNFVTEVFSMCR